jgi:BolA protein
MATIQNNPMEMSIREKLTNQFSPVHLDILNESYMHNVPKGSETHFKVVVVSNKFENTPLLQVSEGI